MDNASVAHPYQKSGKLHPIPTPIPQDAHKHSPRILFFI